MQERHFYDGDEVVIIENYDNGTVDIRIVGTFKVFNVPGDEVLSEDEQRAANSLTSWDSSHST